MKTKFTIKPNGEEDVWDVIKTTEEIEIQDNTPHIVITEAFVDQIKLYNVPRHEVHNQFMLAIRPYVLRATEITFDTSD